MASKVQKKKKAVSFLSLLKRFYKVQIATARLELDLLKLQLEVAVAALNANMLPSKREELQSTVSKTEQFIAVAETNLRDSQSMLEMIEKGKLKKLIAEFEAQRDISKNLKYLTGARVRLSLNDVLSALKAEKESQD